MTSRQYKSYTILQLIQFAPFFNTFFDIYILWILLYAGFFRYYSVIHFIIHQRIRTFPNPTLPMRHGGSTMNPSATTFLPSVPLSSSSSSSSAPRNDTGLNSAARIVPSSSGAAPISKHWLNPNCAGPFNQLSPCLLFNARSIKNKLGEIHHLLYTDKPMIVLITESWLDRSVSDNLLDPANLYHLYRSDRVGRPGGGTCAFVSKTLKSKQVILEDKLISLLADIQCELICFSIHVKLVSYKFILLYLPPPPPILG